MRFLVDAQLPLLLTKILADKGHDAKHVSELPNGVLSTDNEICKFSVIEDRVVISKDADFLDSYILFDKPQKLLLVSTGNIKNNALLNIFRNNIEKIVLAFDSSNLVELSNETIVSH